MKNPELLRARAAALRQQAEGLEQEARALEDGNNQKTWDAIQAAAQRALNGWDTARMRVAREALRGLMATLMKLDGQTHDARVRALNVLREELRLKSEGMEKARLKKRLYVENPKASAAEVEELLAARWEEHRRNL